MSKFKKLSEMEDSEIKENIRIIKNIFLEGGTTEEILENIDFDLVPFLKKYAERFDDIKFNFVD